MNIKKFDYIFICLIILCGLVSIAYLPSTTKENRPAPVIYKAKAETDSRIITAGYSPDEHFLLANWVKNYFPHARKLRREVEIALLYINHPKTNHYCKYFSVPKWVVRMVLTIENSGDIDMVSSANCAGIMMVSKDIAKAAGLTVTDKVDERLNPLRCLYAGIRYLHILHKQFGRWDLAVWAYQQGQTRVAKMVSFYILTKYKKNIPWQKINPLVIKKYRITYIKIRNNQILVNKYFPKITKGYNGGLNYVIKAYAAGKVCLYAQRQKIRKL